METQSNDVPGPNISVVIPTHGGRFLAAAVASVRAQTFGEWELVIVDHGSTDGTADVAANLATEDSRIRVVTNARNTGSPAARNRGISSISATSEYVAFLDHDDVWFPEALQLLRTALIARPTASAAHGAAIWIDRHGSPLPFLRPPRRWGLVDGRLEEWPPHRPTEFANLAYEDCIVSMGSGLIRHTALKASGGFDLRAERADDYDMWIRLSRRGEIAFVDQTVLAYRQHEDQTTMRPPPPRGQGTPYVRYKMIVSPENTAEQRKLAVAGFRARQKRLFAERYRNLRTDLRRRAFHRVSEHILDLAVRAAAYAHGRPWEWHR
jgi:glycosyltransferase involved in cell wall biosynthesis